MNDSPIVMAERQARLTKIYEHDPSQAMITDSAGTRSAPAGALEPLHSSVTAGGFVIPIAVHCAVGGDGDGAVPGDILCASLASCMDSTLRIIANRLRLTLISLEVRATADVDVRGTLCVEPSVPVGFQKMHLSVDLKAAEGTNHKLIAALFKGAKHSCVVFQTLKLALPITIQIHSNIEPQPATA